MTNPQKKNKSTKNKSAKKPTLPLHGNRIVPDDPTNRD